MISLRAFEPSMTSPGQIETLENAIHFVRGQRVMLDSDLAAIYGVSTMRLNEQLRRNKKRFPSDFAFQLTREEFTNLISQIAISRS
ncbi:MAG TPA: ORF6N domain-containing protein, partial [Chthoniobacterales bacterium]